MESLATKSHIRESLTTNVLASIHFGAQSLGATAVGVAVAVGVGVGATAVEVKFDATAVGVAVGATAVGEGEINKTEKSHCPADIHFE